MNENLEHNDMVECHYKGTIIHVPVQLFVSMTMRMDFVGQKFIRYKDAPKMYGMSMSSFKRFIRDSDCIYHPTEKVALINVEKVDKLIEYYQG